MDLNKHKEYTEMTPFHIAISKSFTVLFNYRLLFIYNEVTRNRMLKSDASLNASNKVLEFGV